MRNFTSIKIILGLAFLLNVIGWLGVRYEQTVWMNVPPAPSPQSAVYAGIGDKQFSYRMIGIMIQNLGDAGGRVVALKDYNYDALTDWFYVEDYLDSHSNYIPYLASYYFAASQDPEKFRPVLSYLEEVGKRPEKQKWRWLAQAAYIARFHLHDYDKALQLANELANLDVKGLPVWAKRMPAFVMTAMGEKQAAYALLIETLKTEGDQMQPTEVNALKYYICQKILEKDEAKRNPLCEGIDFD